jgi:hypothetical protein
MSKNLFMQIVQDVKEYDDYFMRLHWVSGISSARKCMYSLTCLLYGPPVQVLADGGGSVWSTLSEGSKGKSGEGIS